MSWWRRKKQERDLERELLAHWEQEAGGQSPAAAGEESARRAAHRALGNTTLIQEITRQAWGWASVERLWQDVQYGLRMLRKNPAFTTTAVVKLALGIGANTAICSLVNVVYFCSLPYRDADRLASLWVDQFRTPGYDSRPASMGDPDFLEWQRPNRSFAEIAAFHAQTSNLTGSGTPERLLGASVTTNLFHLLERERHWCSVPAG